MTYTQTYNYFDDGFGQVVVAFKVSNAYDDLFLTTYPEGDGIATDVFMLESVKQDLNIDDGKFAVDELPFTIRETSCDSADDTDAMFFCLDASDVHALRYCALQFNDETVFIGIINPEISGDDIKWFSDEYETDADPIREYKFTAYSSDVSLLDKASMTGRILDKDNNIIPHVYDRIAAYPEQVGGWEALTEYQEGDIVWRYVEGVYTYYKCRTVNTGNEPPSAEFWIYCGNKLAEDVFAFKQTIKLERNEPNVLYHFPLGNLYDVLNWILDKASSIITELTETEFHISFGESTLFIKTNPVIYSMMNNSWLEITEMKDSPETLIELTLTESPYDTNKSSAFIHRRMINPEWGQGIYPPSNANPEDAASNEYQFSFRKSQNISELMFELARNFGCYIATDYSEGRTITLTFQSRKAIIEESLTYIVGAAEGGFDTSSVFESEPNQYYAVANNYAADGFDTLIAKPIDSEVTETEKFKAAKEEISRLEKKNNIKSERLLLSTSPIMYRPIGDNISLNHTWTYPFNYILFSSTLQDLDHSDKSYHRRRTMVERLHTGIYIATHPVEAKQIELFGANAWIYRPAINIYASDNGEDLKFKTLTEYVNYCMAKDKQYYDTEYTLTIPSWGGFSKSSDGSNPSWKNIKLGSKVRISQNVKHFINGEWVSSVDTRDYAVVGIERNLQVPETKLKLSDVNRFAFGYPSGTTQYAGTVKPCVNEIVATSDSAVTKRYTIATGETIEKGSAVMLLGDGTVALALAHSDYYGKIIGIALESGSAGEGIVVQSSGKIYFEEYSFSNENAQIFVRENAAMASNISESLLETPAGDENMIVLLGKALDSHTFDLNIEEYPFEFSGGSDA